MSECVDTNYGHIQMDHIETLHKAMYRLNRAIVHAHLDGYKVSIKETLPERSEYNYYIDFAYPFGDSGEVHHTLGTNHLPPVI